MSARARPADLARCSRGEEDGAEGDVATPQLLRQEGVQCALRVLWVPSTEGRLAPGAPYWGGHTAEAVSAALTPNQLHS